MNLTESVKQKAIDLGFDLVGVTGADPIADEDAQHLRDWLDAGYAGQMGYMHNNFQKRINPGQLLENARSVIVAALNFTPPKREMPDSKQGAAMGSVAGFGQYEDYHIFIKDRLWMLARYLAGKAGGNPGFKVCVDSVPLAERAIAVRTGLGFTGKNHMLINPRLGCQLLLGEIITTVELEADDPVAGGCAECDRCLEICPTGALRSDGGFDAARCISYLTIEHKGEIEASLAAKMGDSLFGCDRCVEVCPYQKDAPARKTRDFRFYEGRGRIALDSVMSLTEKEFEIEFEKSPLKRAGLERLQRNARICAANIKGIGAVD